MDVNQTIVKILEDLDICHIFGGSGQVNASMLLALRDSQKVSTVIVRNEQAASFMACGYAMFSDKPGVCFATGGPGAFNLFSGMAIAYSDSLPVMAITGYTSRNQRGKGALNESTGLNRTPDSHAMFLATTKKSFILEDPNEVCDIFEEAFHLALGGRPGPVHIHIPKDITVAKVTRYRPIRLNINREYPDQDSVNRAAEAIAQALRQNQKIMLIAGYGTIRSHAKEALLELVETFNIPFSQTMDAKGFLPENHPLCLGVYGTSGDPAANSYFRHAEMVIAIGNSFAQNATFAFKPDLFDQKTLIHINIDPNEINKVYTADIGVTGDATETLKQINELLASRSLSPLSHDLPGGRYFEEASALNSISGKIHPASLVRALSEELPENAIVLGDAGSHMLWLNCYLQLNKNQRYQNPGSFGPMASHTNAAIGVKCANPDKLVVSGSGDGCYLMAGFELLTAVEYNIPVIWIIFNNGEFNVIKKFLIDQFADHAYMKFLNPDYVKYAEACGAAGFRVENIASFRSVFREAMALNKPCLIDAAIDPEVYPPFNFGKT